MKRTELEHVLRAAGAIVDEDALVVIGSQAILAAIPEPAPELTVSNGVSAIAPSPADLAISKLAAGREKDIAFVSAMLRHGYVTVQEIRALVPRVAPEWRERVSQRLNVCDEK